MEDGIKNTHFQTFERMFLLVYTNIVIMLKQCGKRRLQSDETTKIRKYNDERHLLATKQWMGFQNNRPI